MTPMGAAKTQKRTFGQKLRHELDSREMGVRTLARLIVDKEPAAENRDRRIDNVRRQLREYLNGVTPTARSRNKIEDALEMMRDSLKGDDDGDSRVRHRRISDSDLLAALAERIIQPQREPELQDV